MKFGVKILLRYYQNQELARMQEVDCRHITFLGGACPRPPSMARPRRATGLRHA